MAGFAGEEGGARLRERYVERGMSVRDIADEEGVSVGTVQYWLDKHAVDTRGPLGTDDEAPWRDEETLRSLYVKEGLSQEEVADELGCSARTVRKWQRRRGVEIRDPSR
jgi:transposase